jgi:hypothetical protein
LYALDDKMRNAIAHGTFNFNNSSVVLIGQFKKHQYSPINFYASFQDVSILQRWKAEREKLYEYDLESFEAETYSLYFGELSKHILTGYKLDRNTCTLYFDKLAPKIVVLDTTITIRRLADFIEDNIDDLEPYTNYERLIRVNTLHKNSKGQLLGRIVNIKGEDIQIELDNQITTYSFEKLVTYIMLWHRQDNMPQCYITNPSKLKGLYSREHLVHRLKKELYKVCFSNALD